MRRTREVVASLGAKLVDGKDNVSVADASEKVIGRNGRPEQERERVEAQDAPVHAPGRLHATKGMTVIPGTFCLHIS